MGTVEKLRLENPCPRKNDVDIVYHKNIMEKITNNNLP